MPSKEVREARVVRAKERALTLQDREMHRKHTHGVYRYYQSWLDAHGSASTVAAHVQSLANVENIDLEELHTIGYRAAASRDKALTAFAQLAALRLNVRRAMVSLIDSTHQYVLAEGTRTISLIDDTDHAEGDELWLGNTILDREDTICPCVFNRTYTVKNKKGVDVTARATVIPDCREDKDFKDKAYVLKEPGLRFYAGVPIKSRSGHLIGVYAVSSEYPRAPLTYDELSFMQATATAIMLGFPFELSLLTNVIPENLEWAMDRVDRYKGERIVKGLADFVEGSPGMRAARLENGEPPSPVPVTPAASVTANADPMDIPKQSPKRPVLRRGDSKTSTRTRLEASPAPPKQEAKVDTLSKMLDRAARILRESTLAEGVVFFGPTGNSPTKPTLRSAMAARDKMSGTDDEQSKRLSTASLGDLNEGENSTDSDANYQLRSSKVLGISLVNKRDTSLFYDTTLPVNTLESYFKLYPHGKSLHFSDAGSGLSSDDESANESQREGQKENESSAADDTAAHINHRKKKIRMSHQELLRNLPGVKNVIFLPLWDYIEEKMVAGCFLWTSSTGRMMNLDDDLSYLRAFGNTIMSEIARMNAIKDDRAKTTFIASMSHELRSPLHGILGSVEFLQDTATDSYQSGLITSIATCGKTLLETLDHVLDHAKINKLGRARMRRNARSSRVANASVGTSMESINITAEVDLGVVVEEVVEAVTAGHAFKKMHTGELKAREGPVITLSRASSANSVSVGPADGSNINEGAVTVLLDISPRVSWRVRTQPGALRRIIMNLLGNALKYTSSGFVAVSLRAQENINAHKIDATFRVVDSGKGMSDDFQKNRLFLPFSQEDSFQPGTGLGLSIVRQIVDSLGGTIDIKSVQNVGTEVDVRLSLTPAENDVEVPDEEITAVAEKTRGLRMCLLDPNEEKERKSNDHIARLDTTLSEVCWGWFEMEVMKASHMTKTDADIFLYTEPPSVEYLLEHHGVKNESKGNKGKEVPLIIVCLNASEAISVAANHIKKLSDLGRIVEVIAQPCGPRKLAKVLSRCVQRMEETFDRSMNQQGNTLPTREPVQDLGAATVLGLHSSSLPLLSSQEEQLDSARTREYLKDISAELPPSSAVAFPSDDKTTNTTDPIATLSLPDTEPEEGAPHILLVDDNCINIQLLTMFCKKHKFPYQEATNGQEALDTYISFCGPGKQKFDFVLMDISMPVMNGMEATRRIREFEAENEVRKTTVIALTGLASAAAQAEAESSGIDIYMAKPVKFRELRPLLKKNETGPKAKQGKEEENGRQDNRVVEAGKEEDRVGRKEDVSTGEGKREGRNGETEVGAVFTPTSLTIPGAFPR